ncbi:hypothetical protein MRX96_016165 [Rhipicephalus microplus]|uniref:Uncharacterized protein n=1 Tax=Rhipicephalus microplus TaxID=6941 RepID=A0A9J6EMH3_RHIMP|nr:hypothetical protein HPB51_005393 [Rhipicephalus microplus]
MSLRRNRNKLRPPYNAGANLASSEVSATRDRQDRQNSVEDRKSTDRSRRSVHHRGPDRGIEERRRLLPIATAIPKHGRRSRDPTRSWGVRFGETFAMPNARTPPPVSVLYPGPPARYDHNVGCNVAAESTAARYTSYPVVRCSAALALKDVRVLSKSRMACQSSATLGERALTQNADGGRTG